MNPAPVAPRPTPRRIPRRWLLLGGLVFAVVLAEGAARLFLPDLKVVAMDEVLADARYGYRLRPGFDGSRDPDAGRALVRVSEQGFRDDPFGPRQDGDLRVLVLGDSFTYAKEVPREECYSEVLEGLLARRHPDRRVSVLNTGAPSWATFQEDLLLEEIGPKFRPDVVVLQYYANDLADNLRSLPEGIQLLRQRTEAQGGGTGAWRVLGRYSLLARHLWKYQQTRATARIARARERRVDPGQRTSRDLQEDLCLQFVDSIRRRCEALGAGLVLFVVRDPQRQPDPEEGSFLLRHGQEQGIPALRYDDEAARRGVPLSECFQFHFTARGHALAATMLAEALEAHGLLR